MVTIDVNRCGGQIDVANRRLKRMCDKLGILKRMRLGDEEVKPSIQRKKAKKAAEKELTKHVLSALRPSPSKTSKPKTSTHSDYSYDQLDD